MPQETNPLSRKSLMENPLSRKSLGFEASPSLDTSEEPEPIISGSNWGLKILDAVNTPQQMMYGGISGAIKGEDVIDAAVEGARRNISGRDILEQLGVPEWEWTPMSAIFPDFKVPMRGTAGLAADIIADPINLIPGAKIFDLGADLVKGGAKMVPGLAKLIPSLKVPEVKVVKEILRSEAVRRSGRAGRIVEEGRQLAGEIKDVAKKTGLAPEEVGRRAVKVAELKVKPSVIRDKLAAEGVTPTVDAINPLKEDFDSMADYMGQLNRVDDLDELPEILELGLKRKIVMQNQLISELENGLGTVKLDDASVEYFTHAVTPEAKKILRSTSEMKTFGALKYNGRHAFQLERKYRGQGVDDLNALSLDGRLPGYEGKKFKLFEDNPALVETVRRLRGEKAITDARIYRRSAKQIGRRIDDPDIVKVLEQDPMLLTKLKIAQATDPRVANLAGEMGQYVFEPEVARHLDAYFDAAISPTQSTGVGALGQTFLEHFDRVQDEWKLSTLVLFPAYHGRNVVGNIWNNFIGGVLDPTVYGKAAQFQLANPSKAFTHGGRTLSKMEWENELIDFGITRQFSRFLNLQSELALDVNQKLVSKNPIRIAERFGGKVGTFVEDNARVAHYFHKLDQGATPVEATLSVKNHLFDYGDLTDFEKAVLRRIIPFYAWTRFNIPLQLRGLVEHPGKFQALGDVINAVERDRPRPKDSDQLLAGWMRENTAIQVRNDAQGNPEFFLLGGWLPAADIDRMARPVDAIVDSLSPFLKAPIELIANKNLFFGNDIDRFPGDKTTFLNMTLPNHAVNALRNIRVLVEADRLLAAYNKKQGLQDTPMSLTDRHGEDITPAVIRTLFGAKTYPLDVVRQRKEQARTIKDLMFLMKLEASRGREMNVETINKMLDGKEPIDRRRYRMKF